MNALARHFDLAAQAAGTEPQLDATAVAPDSLPVQIGLEGTVGTRRLAHPATGVLVSNITPKGGTFTAQVTLGRHGALFSSNLPRHIQAG